MNAGKTETADARAAVDIAVSDPSQAAVVSEAERREFSERRHLFWRNRCLEHARRLDVLDRRSLELERALMNIIRERHSLDADPEWHSSLVEAISHAQVIVDCPLVFVPDDGPLDGSNPNPPECDPRA